MPAAVLMTFNLRRPSWLDGANAWAYRKERAADAITAGAPDFVGTQEGSRTMLTVLTQRLSGFAWLGEGRAKGSRDETNAILYRQDRWSAETSGTFWLSETPDVAGSRGFGAVFPRICTWGLFRLRADPCVSIAVFNTHLDHISPKARLRGAAIAAGRLMKLSRETGVPAVLIGDFNAGPRSETTAQLCRAPYGLVSAFETAYPGGPSAAGATYHGFRGGGAGGQPIDAMFATNDCVFEAVAVDKERRRGRYPSDHYPVRAIVRWTS